MLVDYEITLLAQDGMVQPFDPACVNPCSLDIRLGTTLLREAEVSASQEDLGKEVYDPQNVFTRVSLAEMWHRRRWITVDISERSKENPFWIKKGEFYLAHSLERFTLPTTVCATFHLKSSRAREGYGHALAGFCDPGWTGSSLTLEIFSHSQYALPLYPGLRIGQLTFHRLEREPLYSYRQTGKYNNDESAQPSKDAIL